MFLAAHCHACCDAIKLYSSLNEQVLLFSVSSYKLDAIGNFENA